MTESDLSLDYAIRSERFDLEPLTVDSAPLFAELAADTEIVKTLIGDWSTAGKRLENAHAWIAAASNYVLWGIYDRDGSFGTAGEFIGICGVEACLPKIGRGPSLYYAFDQAVWGRGVGSEIVAAVIDHLFDATDVEAIEALVFPSLNPASARLLEKQGMCLVGRYPIAEYVGDDCLPTMRYEIWRAQVALPAGARSCLAEAAFKIGQFVAGGVSSHQEMAAALLVSAHENGLVEMIGIDEVKKLIARSLAEGAADSGWLHYRVERKRHRNHGGD
ncbi:MAG TPA: GNAT family N-acetyltransferase [Gammaproteobacteria bacterium]|nr:GNAT family N-acetyltransferase [Gammaproteobacteria bacterium]